MQPHSLLAYACTIEACAMKNSNSPHWNLLWTSIKVAWEWFEALSFSSFLFYYSSWQLSSFFVNVHSVMWTAALWGGWLRIRYSHFNSHLLLITEVSLCECFYSHHYHPRRRRGCRRHRHHCRHHYGCVLIL